MTSQQEMGLQAATVGAAVGAVHLDNPPEAEAQAQDSREQPDPAATSCSNQDASRQPQLEPTLDRIAQAAMSSQPQMPSQPQVRYAAYYFATIHQRPCTEGKRLGGACPASDYIRISRVLRPFHKRRV